MNNRKYLVFMFLGSLLFILIFFGLGLDKPKENQENPNITEDPISTETEDKPLVYSSSRYDFSFSVPNSYKILESSSDLISVGVEENGSFRNLINIEVIISDENFEQQSYEEFVLDETRISCAEQGTGYFIECPEIDDLREVTTVSGISGQRFNLIAHKTDLSDDSVEKMNRGPYVTFNISQEVGRPAFLKIYPPTTISFGEIDQALLGHIVGSLSIGD